MKLNAVLYRLNGEKMKKITILGLFAIGLISQTALSIPSMQELLGRLQTTQLSQITGKHALPWLGGATFLGISCLGLNWYKKSRQKKAQAEFADKQALFAEKFAHVMQHENVKNDYSAALISAINDFTQSPDDKIKAEYVDYAYNQVMAAHFEDEKDNPSPLEIINKPLSTKLTPLMTAVSNANVNAVKWLLKKGANPWGNASGEGWKSAAELNVYITATMQDKKIKQNSMQIYEMLESIVDAPFASSCHDSKVQTLDFAMQCRDYYNKIL